MSRVETICTKTNVGVLLNLGAIFERQLASGVLRWVVLYDEPIAVVAALEYWRLSASFQRSIEMRGKSDDEEARTMVTRSVDMILEAERLITSMHTNWRGSISSFFLPSL
jgi:hypothetical protein